MEYKSVLSLLETEIAIKFIKDTFEVELAKALKLTRVSAPLFVQPESGLNDNLNGYERAVKFDVLTLKKEVEIVQSLAKWKRMALAKYGFKAGEGLYTDMNAIRADEELDNIHSLYVDQWDWEQAILEQDRNLEYLKDVVRKIYRCIKRTEFFIYDRYPRISPILPEEITFVFSEDLQKAYPNLSGKERENIVAEKYGAVFIIGIGA
ncbi:MAG: aspartate--ammonia ligase, partial [Clostridia bacterium]|nr:aspartate--ammonia ligase [Clostridia bacterium]